jgi:protein gp37
MMTYYVKRYRHSTERTAWVGPIRSERQAEREAQAWRDARDSFDRADWTAEVHESTPEIRREVRAWQREARSAAHA